jgi:hypothetical protein
MRSDAQQTAQAALSIRLRELLPPETTERFIGGTHTCRFADNLLPSFSAEQVETLCGQLARGAGEELAATASGKRRAHAPYSSAALAANAFGGWIGAEHQLQIAGLGGFDTSISLEHKLRIAHRGGTANLDCLLQSPSTLVGIESKLTEPLARHQPVEWKAPYKTEAMAALLQDGWLEAFQASLTGAWKPQHLGLEQLLKHALALNSHAAGRVTHLVYVYWEPANGSKIPEVTTHRAEVAELARTIEDAQPHLHPLSYEEMLDEWISIPDDIIRPADHVNCLRARYGNVKVAPTLAAPAL